METHHIGIETSNRKIIVEMVKELEKLNTTQRVWLEGSRFLWLKTTWNENDIREWIRKTKFSEDNFGFSIYVWN